MPDGHDPGATPRPPLCGSCVTACRGVRPAAATASCIWLPPDALRRPPPVGPRSRPCSVATLIRLERGAPPPHIPVQDTRDDAGRPARAACDLPRRPRAREVHRLSTPPQTAPASTTPV